MWMSKKSKGMQTLRGKRDFFCGIISLDKLYLSFSFYVFSVSSEDTVSLSVPFFIVVNVLYDSESIR